MDPQVELQAPPASTAPPGTPADAARAEFSGAETEEAVISARYEGFSCGTALNTAHERAAREETVPLARTLSEHWQRLRDRARGRARPAQARKTAVSRRAHPARIARPAQARKTTDHT